MNIELNLTHNQQPLGEVEFGSVISLLAYGPEEANVEQDMYLVTNDDTSGGMVLVHMFTGEVIHRDSNTKVTVRDGKYVLTA